MVFASKVLAHTKDLPISFEVFFDDFDEMEGRARIIDSWCPNVYVKIPVTNTKRVFAAEVNYTLMFCRVDGSAIFDLASIGKGQ